MKYILFLAGIISILLFTGCGASVITINTATLDYPLKSYSDSTSSEGHYSIIISDISDERPSFGDICNSYDTDGQIDGKWNASKEVRTFIKEAISSELAAEGVEVITSADKINDMNILRLKGRVKIFYGWLEGKSNYASRVSVDFVILNKSYNVFYKSYLGENNTGSCGLSLMNSTKDALHKAAVDIKEILIKEAAYVK